MLSIVGILILPRHKSKLGLGLFENFKYAMESTMMQKVTFHDDKKTVQRRNKFYKKLLV